MMSYRYRHECPDGCKVFVGNLNRFTKREELESIFGRFGRLRNVWMATNPPGFAFIMYEHRGDAEKAVQKLNNTPITGRYVTVEKATGIQRTDNRYHKNGRHRGHYRHNDRHRDRHRERGIDGKDNMYDHKCDHRLRSRRHDRHSDHNRSKNRVSVSRSRSFSPQRHRKSNGSVGTRNDQRSNETKAKSRH